MVTITNDGLVWAAKRAAGIDSVAAMTYLELGTGTTAEANDHTALVTPITDSGLARAAATCSYEADYKTVLQKTWTATGTKAIREVGAFNASSDGTNARGDYDQIVDLVLAKAIEIIDRLFEEASHGDL